MKRFARIVSTLILSLSLAACGGREQQQTRSSNKPLTIKGSDTMVILAQRLAEEYMTRPSRARSCR